MRHTILSTAAALFTSFMLMGSAWAGPASDTVKGKQTELFNIVAQPKTAARQDRLRQLFDEMLDYEAFTRGSMGKNWDTLTPEQQAKFRDLLTRLVRNNYRRNLKKMLDYNISYAGEKAVAGGTVVMTRAKHKTDARQPELEIDFQMAQVGGRLKMVDMITERASLVKTYRSQFARIMRKKGFDELMRKLQKKLRKLENS